MSVAVEERLLCISLEDRGLRAEVPRLDPAVLLRRTPPVLDDSEPAVGHLRPPWTLKAAVVLLGAAACWAVGQILQAGQRDHLSQDRERRPVHVDVERFMWGSSRSPQLKDLALDVPGISLYTAWATSGRFAGLQQRVRDLRRFPKLRSLSILSRGQRSVIWEKHWEPVRQQAPQLFADLALLRGLEHLHLGGCLRLDKGALQTLALLPKLHTLYLELPVSEAGALRGRVELPKLRHLWLDVHNIGRRSQVLRLVKWIKGLHSLGLGDTPFLPPDLGQLADLDALAHLDLSLGAYRGDPRPGLPSAHLPLDLAALTALSRLPGLRSLELRGRAIDVPREGGRILARFEELRALGLGGGRMRGLDLGRLPVALEELLLVESGVGGGDLACLRRLRRLDLSRSASLTDEDLAVLRGRGIEELNLHGCRQLGRESLDILRSMPNLRRLDVSGLTWIDDAALVSLSKIGGLEELTLGGSVRLGDRGLLALRGLKRLRSLELRGIPRLSTAALGRLLREGGPIQEIRIGRCSGIALTALQDQLRGRRVVWARGPRPWLLAGVRRPF